MAKIVVKSRKDFLKMPWKNGRGTTEQIFLHPDSASLDKADFDLRLSMAPILEKSEFSLFPAHQRQLTVLEGKGIKVFQDDKVSTLGTHDIFSFSGSETISGEPIGTGVLDFGLMSKKGLEAEWDILDFKKKTRSFSLRNHWAGIFVAKGEFQWEAFPSGEEQKLKPYDFISVYPEKGEVVLSFEPLSPTGTLFYFQCSSIK